jgi:hypothetical protein
MPWRDRWAYGAKAFVVTARAIAPTPGVLSCFQRENRSHLAADWISSPDDPNWAPKADRKTGISCDFAIDRWRHLIENFFCNFKRWRGIATKYA